MFSQHRPSAALRRQPAGQLFALGGHFFHPGRGFKFHFFFHGVPIGGAFFTNVIGNLPQGGSLGNLRIVISGFKVIQRSFKIVGNLLVVGKIKFGSPKQSVNRFGRIGRTEQEATLTAKDAPLVSGPPKNGCSA